MHTDIGSIRQSCCSQLAMSTATAEVELYTRWDSPADLMQGMGPLQRSC